jgi:23S rRNA pseudouridine2604 synthase
MVDQPRHDNSPMRINRWFTDQGICSRREADRWIADGRVTINGRRAELGSQVAHADKVALDGRPLQVREKRPIVIAYNKPVGIECTSDPKVADNIIAAVNYPERLVHIGRLDQMSEGLILLTNRGDIVNGILRSEFEHEKEYLVELSGPIDDAQITLLSRGVDIGDGRGRTKPCYIERRGENRLKVVLTEGRNRQIRRMAEVVGNHVKRLERVRIMHVRLGPLARGEWRHLSADEVRELFLALGLERPEGSLRPPRVRPNPIPEPRSPQNLSERPDRPERRPSRDLAERPERRPSRDLAERPERRPSRDLSVRPERPERRPSRDLSARPDHPERRPSRELSDQLERRPSRDLSARPERPERRPSRELSDQPERRPSRDLSARPERPERRLSRDPSARPFASGPRSGGAPTPPRPKFRR